ncbi:uncharacterized protein LOC133195589 [Saccostrea echinata]|uniref:uncharacterized protein LOC133195589 n=1 Tax=Saccostrea echinata TaxID=191078 RepID=UPI002A81D445|nr:uncharacterized protein LOC133195589 [Saccostrea echinata]
MGFSVRVEKWHILESSVILNIFVKVVIGGKFHFFSYAETSVFLSIWLLMLNITAETTSDKVMATLMIFTYFYVFFSLFASSNGYWKDRKGMERLEEKVANLEDFTMKLLKKLEMAENDIQSLTTENVQIRKELQETRLQVQILEKQDEASKIPSPFPEFHLENWKATESSDDTKTQDKNHDNVTKSKINKRLLEGNVIHPTAPQITKTRVGFMAVTTDSQMHMGVNQVVLFPNVIENVGNGLDPHSSIFKAPVSGLYIFSASILSHAGVTVRCVIVKNSQDVAYIFSGDSTTYSSGSKTALLDLTVGDDVWIKIYDISDVHVYGGAWSSFMGVLVS